MRVQVYLVPHAEWDEQEFPDTVSWAMLPEGVVVIDHREGLHEDSTHHVGSIDI